MGTPIAADADVDDAAAERVTSLFKQAEPALLRLARTLTLAAEAEDLVQDVFVQALTATRRDPDYLKEPAWSWIRTALVRLTISRQRRVSRELARLIRLYEPPRREIWDEDVDLARGLRSLPPRMRACVVLRYGEDMLVDDIATTLGCSAGAVSAQLSVGRQRLRKWLTATGERP